MRAPCRVWNNLNIHFEISRARDAKINIYIESERAREILPQLILQMNEKNGKQKVCAHIYFPPPSDPLSYAQPRSLKCTRGTAVRGYLTTWRRQAGLTRRRLPCQQGKASSSASLRQPPWRRPVAPPSLPLLASVWAGRPGWGRGRVKVRGEGSEWGSVAEGCSPP